MVRFLNKTDIEVAVDILYSGGLVAFPTETVYGLAGNAYDDDVVSSIFQYKLRPSFKPISVCYPNFGSAENDVDITELARFLSDRFLPGPLTMVLNRKKESRVSLLCSAGEDTLGIRVPNNEIALTILQKLDFPLALPSANKSQEFSATSAQDVAKGLGFNENLTIINDGTCDIGLESTIVDLTEKIPIVTRVGALSVETLERVCGINFIVQEKNGMKHYKLRKKVVINAFSAGKNDAFVGFGNTTFSDCKYFYNLSESGNLLEAAKNFFSVFQQITLSDVDKIYVAPIPAKGIGLAINSRLEQMTE